MLFKHIEAAAEEMCSRPHNSGKNISYVSGKVPLDFALTQMFLLYGGDGRIVHLLIPGIIQYIFVPFVKFSHRPTPVICSGWQFFRGQDLDLVEI